MKSSIFATAALVAATTAESVGSAIVVNKCNYDVYLYNTPSSGGGYTSVDKVLSTDDTYTQQWTELSNGNGWSIKLSKDTDLTDGDILQYEYTWQNDGTIWYDLSAVDGNPWDGNWEIPADSATCVPRQAAYRYATDDAYGMQSCPEDATITVTLCSGESQNDAGAASASSSLAAATESTAAASSTKTASSAVNATISSTQSPSTTLQTSVITSAAASTSKSGNVVVTVTNVATTTTWSRHWGGPGKRDAHHHAHAARHPHARN